MSELIPGTISMSLGSKVYDDLKTRLEKTNMTIRTAITELNAHKNGPYHFFYSVMYYAASCAITQILKDISTYDRDSEKIGGKRFYDEEYITTFFATCDEFDCNNLTHFPNSIDNVPPLTTLDIQYCNYLTHLPESLCHLSALTTLDIRDCNNLTHLPESIGNLPPLTTLDIRDCNNLTHLLNSIDNVPPLTTLDIQYCKNVPGSFHQVVKNAKSRDKHAYRAHFNAAASATTATDPAFTAAAAHAATTKHDLNLARARAAARH